MSIERVDMYRVLCDTCRKPDDSDDYYAWVEPDQAIYSAESSEWLVVDDGQWCPDCIAWDEEKDEMVPRAAASTREPT